MFNVFTVRFPFKAYCWPGSEPHRAKFYWDYLKTVVVCCSFLWLWSDNCAYSLDSAINCLSRESSILGKLDFLCRRKFADVFLVVVQAAYCCCSRAALGDDVAMAAFLVPLSYRPRLSGEPAPPALVSDGI